MTISWPVRAILLLLVAPLAFPGASAAGIGGGCVALDVRSYGETGTPSLTPTAHGAGVSAGAGAAGHGVTVSVLVAPFSCVDAPSLPQTISPLGDLQTHASDSRLPALP